MSKEEKIFNYLYEKVFADVINSKTASEQAKNIVKQTMMCLKQLPAKSMRQYFWNALAGIDNNGEKANNILIKEGFISFVDIKDEFKEKFNDEFFEE